MNNKLTLPGISSLMSKQTGLSKKVCEDFVRELCQEASAALEVSETVRIKGLGSFRTIPVQPRRSVDVTSGENIEIAGHYKVSFTPSRDLSRAVNAPFGAFDTVEIPSDLPDDRLQESPSPEPVETENENIAPEETVQEEPLQEETVHEEPLQEETVHEEPETTHHHRSRHHHGSRRRWRFGLGFAAGFVTAAIIAGGAMLYIYRDRLIPDFSADGLSDTVIAEQWPASDGADTISNQEPGISEEAVPTRPSDSSGDMASAATEAVIDTITRTRYLTTMAKDHYGNFNLWPYIYEENSAILGHPDRIRPGTPVVVPPLSKYGVDPHNPEHIRIAKQKGADIYARYR
ncbi:MAG: HU family DNA-binding protein [Muribaculaceae bacterium]|nr:HU family DNA-binding protein [Muribaculaceae bacterium]